MANTKKKNENESVAAVEEAAVEKMENRVVVESTPKKAVAKDIDMHQYITVYNGFHGHLVYTCKRTGETFIWEDFGDSQEIELVDLKSAKGSAKKFFVNNWFMFDPDDEWVIDYLGIGQYYKDAVALDSFDELFNMSPDELAERISKLSKGQKRSVAYRARQLISENGIDSNKVIDTLEKSLGTVLVEK